jgi:hypothetical protein
VLNPQNDLDEIVKEGMGNGTIADPSAGMNQIDPVEVKEEKKNKKKDNPTERSVFPPNDPPEQI